MTQRTVTPSSSEDVRLTLLGMGAGARMLVVAAMLAVLWLAVWWAVQ